MSDEYRDDARSCTIPPTWHAGAAVIKKLGIGCGGLVLLVIILVAVSSGAKAPTTVTSGGSGAPVTTTAPQAKVGDKIASGNWEYTVTKVENAKTIKWSDFNNTTDAKGQWLIVAITLKNIGNSNFPINNTDFQVVDSGGVKYDVTSELGAYSFVTYQKLTPCPWPCESPHSWPRKVPTPSSLID